MKKVVLRRPMLGPDGRLYKRTNDADRVIVHSFPDEWKLPKTAKSVEEAVEDLEPKSDLPEPETLDEIAKKAHGKK